ncbi:DUF47 family protein [Streptomyces thermolineatus]|uniref:DUF47 family protein n=1 Tax=Streptomyces thermolineatus TaxID=44033 RepID=A0ABN3MY36_9ACTN
MRILPVALCVHPIAHGYTVYVLGTRIAHPTFIAPSINESESAAPRRLHVRFRLTPRETSFYDMFAASADNIVTGSKLLMELLGADTSARSEIADRMRAAEHAGDDATHAIFHQLNSSFITPFDREDIYSLASSLDDVMDFMEEAVDLVVLYQIEELPKGIDQQIEVLARAAELTAEAMPNLRTMSNLTEYWIEVNRLENQADQIHRKLLAHLFNNGKYDAIEVLKLKQVVDVLEEAADAFEHVANTVETIAVKES